jgi:transitional endoplasmic reticulum ATPase
MRQADVRFLFDSFKKNKEQGLQLIQKGNNREAHYHIIQAARCLFELAKAATGRIRTARVENAKQLLEMAKTLDLKAKKSGETAKKVADGDETAAPDDWIVQEKPNVRFDDIAGLETVKEQVRIKMIYPFTHAEKAEHYGVRKGGGILLYGPPGTGKTMIARAIAGELDATFFAILPSKVLSKWVGEAEKNIQTLFESAHKCERAVIFLDEIESLLPKRRDSESTVMQRVVPQILAELDGFEKAQSPLLFIGATNEPWSLDYAVMRPGRFDEKIYVGLPDPPARKKILEMNTKKSPLAGDVSLDELSQKLEGFSGADIAYLCRKVAETVFQESVEKATDRQMGKTDFDAVLREIKPSVTKKELDRFDKFAAER